MKRILLVEDHHAFSDALAAVLEREPDFEVVGRPASMAEVRALDTSGGFDVAVVDVRLPDGDGTDLIRELREANPRASVLVLTIVPEHARHVRAKEMGAEKILGKDATIDEIVGAIKQLGRGRLEDVS